MFGGFVGGAIFATLGGFVLGWITSLRIEVNWETVRFIGYHVDPFIQSTLLQCVIWSVICTGIGVAYFNRHFCRAIHRGRHLIAIADDLLAA